MTELIGCAIVGDVWKVSISRCVRKTGCCLDLIDVEKDQDLPGLFDSLLKPCYIATQLFI